MYKQDVYEKLRSVTFDGPVALACKRMTPPDVEKSRKLREQIDALVEQDAEPAKDRIRNHLREACSLVVSEFFVGVMLPT